MILPHAQARPEPAPKHERYSLAVVSALLVLGAALVFVPFAASIVFASWLAIVARPWMKVMTRVFRGGAKAAALVTTVVSLAILALLVAAVAPLVADVIAMVSDVKRSGAWPEAARSIVGSDARVDLVELGRSHVAQAWAAASGLLITSGFALLRLMVFVATFFIFSVQGERLAAWLKDHVPLKGEHFERLASAYAETGRGLVVGVGVTALIQGVIATITYYAVDLPRAFALGLLTTIAALIPSGGTMLIWIPIATILALTGHPAKAAIVATSGALFIGSVDNVVKPLISRWASLKMSPVLLFVSMLGGILAFGPAGLAFGPLFVRLSIEVLTLAREERLVGSAPILLLDEHHVEGDVPPNHLIQGGSHVAPSNSHS